MAILPSSFPFNVLPGIEINQNIGFNPTGCVVANYSPYYIYLPDGLSFVPPWTSGAIVPLAHATQARATWLSTPFGAQSVTDPPAGATYSAQFTFTDDPNLSYAGGTAISNPFSSLKCARASWTSVAAGFYTGGGSGTIPLGSTIRALMFQAIVNAAVGGNVSGLIRCALTDTTSQLFDIGNIIAVPDVPSTLSYEYPESASFQDWNDPSVSATGNLKIQITDIVGVNTYHVVATCIYV